MRLKNLSNKQIYDINYAWKPFELKKDEITMAAYKEYLKLKAILENKREKRR